MPYKKTVHRNVLDHNLKLPVMANAGELSYVVTQVIKKYLTQWVNIQWETYADVIKAVDSAIDAYKEEVLLPYERKKRKENGDVF